MKKWIRVEQTSSSGVFSVHCQQEWMPLHSVNSAGKTEAVMSYGGNALIVPKGGVLEISAV